MRALIEVAAAVLAGAFACSDAHLRPLIPPRRDHLHRHAADKRIAEADDELTRSA